MSCHYWGNKAKTLHSHTYPGPHPGTSGAIYRNSQCPPALSREGEMQSESMKLHVPVCSAQNGSSAGSVREPRCFLKFSQLFFQFWSHFPPLSYGKSFAATYQHITNIWEEGKWRAYSIHLTVPLQMCLKAFLGWRAIFPFILSFMFSPKFNSEREKPLLLHNWKSPNTLIVLPGKASNDIINLQTLFNTWRQLFHKQQITKMQTKWRDGWKTYIFPK